MDIALYEQLPTVEGKPARRDWRSYPGSRRIVVAQSGPPSDSVLIKTAGNALQAVSRQVLEQKDLIAVSVPENRKPGDLLLVASPDGTGHMIEAVVPENCFPGHTLLVHVPEFDKPVVATGIPVRANSEDIKSGGYGGTQVVQGHNIEQSDLHLSVTEAEEQPASQQQPGQVELVNSRDESDAERGTNNGDSELVLVKVPPGEGSGSKIRVKVKDGRTVEATVPEGNVSEFYLRLPPRRQSWHDNPVAVAPMTVAPFLL